MRSYGLLGVSNHNHALFATALTPLKNIPAVKKICTYQKEYLILLCVRVGVYE